MSEVVKERRLPFLVIVLIAFPLFIPVGLVGAAAGEVMAGIVASVINSSAPPEHKYSCESDDHY